MFACLPMSIALRPKVCGPVCPDVCRSVSRCLWVCLCPYACRSACFQMFLGLCPDVCKSMSRCLQVYMSRCLQVCPEFCRPACPDVRGSVCPCVCGSVSGIYCSKSPNVETVVNDATKFLQSTILCTHLRFKNDTITSSDYTEMNNRMQRDGEEKWLCHRMKCWYSICLEMCFPNLFDHGAHLVLKFRDRTQEASVKQYSKIKEIKILCSADRASQYNSI